MPAFVVAATKHWNIRAFEQYSPVLPGDWHLITDPADLTVERLADINPGFVFFPHWSWIVPETIFNRWDCVCFHASDVPYGRGGSPIQNLIIRGHHATKLTALKMVEDLDAGPVYAKHDLSLEGDAQDIFENMALVVWDMIADITRRRPTPQPQRGDAVTFARRKPEQSLVPENADAELVYNHIRMLDAESYPKAFIQHGEWRLEFDQVVQGEAGPEARVRFIPNPKKQ